MICCVMTAVVECRSRDGGSPIIAAFSTPPARGASCAAVGDAASTRPPRASQAIRVAQAVFTGSVSVARPGGRDRPMPGLRAGGWNGGPSLARGRERVNQLRLRELGRGAGELGEAALEVG